MTDYNVVDSEESFKPTEHKPYSKPSNVISDVRNSMGYSDRPVNQKRSVRNVFLESASIVADETISSSSVASINDTLTITNIVGKLNWTVSSGKLVSPAQGTYIITGYVSISGIVTPPTTVYSLGLYVSINGGAAPNIGSTVASVLGAITVAYIVNLNKGDTIEFKGANNYTTSLDFLGRMTITKLS